LAKRKEFDTLIDGGDSNAIAAAVRDPEWSTRFQRRILSRLYSTDSASKWRAVYAFGVAVGEGGLSEKRISGYVQRFLWSMSDESGDVPYGIPEALGEILACRSEMREKYVPILVSYLVHEELVQTGPILAGAIWALGRVGINDDEERQRVLPGLRAALTSDEIDVVAAALWTSGRLGLAPLLQDEMARAAEISATACLLVDGEIRHSSLGDLARHARN